MDEKAKPGPVPWEKRARSPMTSIKIQMSERMKYWLGAVADSRGLSTAAWCRHRLIFMMCLAEPDVFDVIDLDTEIMRNLAETIKATMNKFEEEAIYDEDGWNSVIGRWEELTDGKYE